VAICYAAPRKLIEQRKGTQGSKLGGLGRSPKDKVATALQGSHCPGGLAPEDFKSAGHKGHDRIPPHSPLLSLRLWLPQAGSIASHRFLPRAVALSAYPSSSTPDPPYL
jgi:hypothetical protein